MADGREVIEFTFSYTEKGVPYGSPRTVRLVVTNIPGGWRMLQKNAPPTEKPGLGHSRDQAVAAWIGANWGPQRIEPENIPAQLLNTLFGRADQRALGQILGQAILDMFKIKR